jgi:CheY-like chemotaxis protein
MFLRITPPLKSGTATLLNDSDAPPLPVNADGLKTAPPTNAPPLAKRMIAPIIKTMKILIVGDHPIYRKGLVALLDQMEPDVVLLQANDAVQALALIAAHDDLDVIILDLLSPEWMVCVRFSEFGQLRPELPVIILSSSENPSDVRSALANGAL